MSMNLYCSHVDLWQTPTDVTFMCCTHDETQPIKRLECYLEWVKARMNGAWDNEQEYRAAREVQEDHIREVQAIIDMPPKGLEVHMV